MKKFPQYCCFFILISFIGISFGQVNLVPNSSFEDTLDCPTNQGQIDYSAGWYNCGDSPDYFNSCTITPNFGVPNNWGGYQQASYGNAYIGIGTYLSLMYGLNNIREIVGIQLSSDLVIGTKYFVSFQANLSLSSPIQVNCASNKLGVMFTNEVYSWMNPPPINNNPQVFTNTIITDTAVWTRVFGSFVADSMYRYLMLGNFFDDQNTDTIIMDTNSYCNSYYFIDDVCVSTDSLFALNYTYNTGMQEYNNQIKFLIYPNPTDEYFFVETNGEPFTIRIYDILGNELFSSDNVLSSKYQVNLSDVNRGLLLISISTGKYNFNYNLIKN